MIRHSLGIYVHIPWCVAKCPYCDFNSHGLNGREPAQDAYVEALVRDLAWEHDRVGGHSVDTVFFGGGTPSLFEADAIALLIDAIAGQFDLADDAEITLEANPGTVEAQRFAGYRAAGVNRISLGIQSLDDAMLKRLGRIHNAAEARAAYDTARGAGFDNINLDLMFALPEQSVDGALAELDGLIAWQPEHLSWYELTLEPGTAFARRPPPLPDEDASVAMWEAGMQRLAGAGFAQYEVSAYAREGRQCRHNLNYWNFGDYLGVGAGAHGKHGFERRERVKTPAAFMKHAGTAKAIVGLQTIEPEQRAFEFGLNRFRLNAPVQWQEFEFSTGLSRSQLSNGFSRLLASELAIATDDGFALTDLGRRHLDSAVSLLLPDGPAK